MANTKPPQKLHFKTVLEDAKALVTVLAMEGESILRRTMRVRRVIVLFIAAIALLLLLLNWFIFPDTDKERQGLAVVFAISLGGVAAIFGLYPTRQTLLDTRKHEAARATEAALRACLEQLGNLLMNEGWRIEDEEGETDNILRRLARAEVLSVLGTLDGDRKRILVRFLYESDLLKKNIPGFSLRGANLSEADLGRLTLSDSLLSGVRLRGANLSRAKLDEADLSDSDLQGAIFQGADLRGAIFQGAIFQGADFRGADFRGADLWGADLRGAGLYGAQVTEEQLANTLYLQGATMPDR